MRKYRHIYDYGDDDDEDSDDIENISIIGTHIDLDEEEYRVKKGLVPSRKPAWQQEVCTDACTLMFVPECIDATRVYAFTYCGSTDSEIQLQSPWKPVPSVNLYLP